MATFKKSDLLDLVYGEENDALERVAGDISGTGRWSIHHWMVFKDKGTGRFYQTRYSVGATESQDESPFEYDGDDIVCIEVRPVEKVVTVYEGV